MYIIKWATIMESYHAALSTPGSKVGVPKQALGYKNGHF